MIDHHPLPRIQSPTTRGGVLRRCAWSALGTTCSVQCVTEVESVAEAFFHAAVQWVARFEMRYSRYRPDSIISQINQAAGAGWVQIDAETEQVLDVCAAIAALSDGLLDASALPLLRLWNYKAEHPRLPSADEIARAKALVGWAKVERKPGAVRLPLADMALDLGGWGKEYAVDAVTEIGRQHGLTALLVDFGHDIRALGAPPGKPAWHVGLEDPHRPGQHRGSIALRDRAIASSGDYVRQFTIAGKRYGHIVDPRSGQPVSSGALQATVLAPTCLQAGVLSTVSFILGPEAGLKKIQDTHAADGLIVTDRARYQTRGFFNYVVES